MSYAHLKATATGAALIVEERGDERSRADATVGVAFEDRRAYLFHADTGERIS